MDLPVEIRLEIYRYLLTTQDSIENPGALIRARIYVGKDERTYPNRSMQILRLSKPIYHEALPIFYQENTFSFSNADDIMDFQVKGLFRGTLCGYSHIFNLWKQVDRLTYIRRLDLVFGSDHGLAYEQLQWSRISRPFPNTLKPEFPGVSELCLDFGTMEQKEGFFEVDPILEMFTRPGGLQTVGVVGVTRESHRNELRKRLLSKDGSFEFA